MSLLMCILRCEIRRKGQYLLEEAAEEDNRPAEGSPVEEGNRLAGEGSRPGDSSLGWTLLLVVFVFKIAQR